MVELGKLTSKNWLASPRKLVLLGIFIITAIAIGEEIVFASDSYSGFSWSAQRSHRTRFNSTAVATSTKTKNTHSATNSPTHTSITETAKDDAAQLVLTGVCLEHFRTLYALDPAWGIEYYGGENSDESKRKVNASVQHIRAFSNCFLDNRVDVDIDLADLESRLFPAFTGMLPTFTRWDGLKIENEFPNGNNVARAEIEMRRQAELKETNATSDSPEILDERASIPKQERDEQSGAEAVQRNSSFWRNVTDHMNGRGIVISMSENGVGEMKQLLLVLRALHNKLPIQIIHKGDLSEESQQELITAARTPKNISAPNAVFLNETGQLYWPTDTLEDPQEIWFVNATATIAPPSWGHFDRYNNKWIAMLFTSFDEMMIMDTDAVPFVQPDYFFNTPEFLETQAYFFKDRPISDLFINWDDQQFLKSLLPSDRECEIFGMTKLTNFTYDNVQLKSRYEHLMESGIVVMKRSTHMPGLLMSTSLQLWAPSSHPTYGDKELFWLGQAAAGSENYRFNVHTAAALGKLIEGTVEISPSKTEEQEEQESPSASTESEEPQSSSPVDVEARSMPDYYTYNYTCSAQPAHLDSNYKLLWTNSGLNNCKRPKTADTDWDMFDQLHTDFATKEEYKSWLESPLDIVGAMISDYVPVDDMQKYWGLSGFRQASHKGCAGYIWCAYENEEYPSEWHAFTAQEIQDINFIKTIWNLPQ